MAVSLITEKPKPFGLTFELKFGQFFNYLDLFSLGIDKSQDNKRRGKPILTLLYDSHQLSPAITTGCSVLYLVSHKT